MQAWLEHFKEIFNPINREEPCTETLNTPNNTREDNILNLPITFEEVQSAVGQLDDSKAPGLDRLCPSLLKNSRIIQYLRNLFQACFRLGTVPQSWLGSIIQPI